MESRGFWWSFTKKLQIWLWLYVNFGDVFDIASSQISKWFHQLLAFKVLLDLLPWKLRQKIGPLWPGTPNWGPVYREKWWFEKPRLVKESPLPGCRFNSCWFTSFEGGQLNSCNPETQKPILLWWICSFFCLFLVSHWKHLLDDHLDRSHFKVLQLHGISLWFFWGG